MHAGSKRELARNTGYTVHDKENFFRFPRFISRTGTLFPRVRRRRRCRVVTPETYPLRIEPVAPAAINLFGILLNALTSRSAINRFLPLSRQFCQHVCTAAVCIDPKTCTQKLALFLEEWSVAS